MNITYVVAGNYGEFVSWCRDMEVSPMSPLVKYIGENDHDKLQGIENPRVVYYGSWWDRKDLISLTSLIASRTRRNTTEKKRYIALEEGTKAYGTKEEVETYLKGMLKIYPDKTYVILEVKEQIGHAKMEMKVSW